MSNVECIRGTCPKCNGEASVYLNPDEDGSGHIYCLEEGCGWVHRNMSNVKRHFGKVDKHE